MKKSEAIVKVKVSLLLIDELTFFLASVEQYFVFLGSKKFIPIISIEEFLELWQVSWGIAFKEIRVYLSYCPQLATVDDMLTVLAIYTWKFDKFM